MSRRRSTYIPAEADRQRRFACAALVPFMVGMAAVIPVILS